MPVPPPKRKQTKPVSSAVVSPTVVTSPESFIYNVRLTNSDGLELTGEGASIQLNGGLKREDLMALVKDMTGNEEEIEMSFYVKNQTQESDPAINNSNASDTTANDDRPFAQIEITSSLQNAIEQTAFTGEDIISIVCFPRSEFTVRPVTRCAQSAKGHAEAVLTMSFSPDGTQLVTGGGDSHVRIWDVGMGLPISTLKRHKLWVQKVLYSPCGRWIASGSMGRKDGFDGELYVWNPRQKQDKSAKRHDCIQLNAKQRRGHVLSLCWEPVHLMLERWQRTKDKIIKSSGDDDTELTLKKTFIAPYLAVGDSRGQLDVWDIQQKTIVAKHTLHSNGHKKDIVDIRWSGSNVIYSCSRDGAMGELKMNAQPTARLIKKHNHWVNCLALNSWNVLRAGPFHAKKCTTMPETMQEIIDKSLENYQDFLQHIGAEVLASGSDDNKILLYNDLTNLEKSCVMITGHQHPINSLQFSPNGQLLGSGSFDKSVRLWNGITGKHIHTFRGHVGRVYNIHWAPDSRWLLSGSQDSTLKVWDTKKMIRMEDLPGHSDEIYAIEWSIDGKCVASAGKDHTVRFWKP